MTRSPVQVVVEYSDDVHYVGYRASDDVRHDVQIDEGRFTLTHVGDRDYDIFLESHRDLRSPVQIRVVEGKTSLFERSIGPESR